MTDKDGNPVSNGYQGFLPYIVNIADNGTITLVTAYSGTVLSDNAEVIIANTHKGSSNWPDLP
jgi:hypothetical protein